MNIRYFLQQYGVVVREFRIKKGLSQMELEIKCSLSVGTISRIENGKVNPTKETLYRIAEVLDLKLEEKVKLFALK